MYFTYFKTQNDLCIEMETRDDLRMKGRHKNGLRMEGGSFCDNM